MKLKIAKLEKERTWVENGAPFVLGSLVGISHVG